MKTTLCYLAGLCLMLTAVTCASAQSLPTGWGTSDIGAVGATGSAAAPTAGDLVVKGAGADIWGSADAFRFAYTQLTGDGSIVAQVAAVDAINGWTKAGIMMRETLAAGSRHVMMTASPAKGHAYQRRLAAGGTSVHLSGGTGAAPVGFKLTRAGHTFRSYRSTNGSTWTQVGSDTIAMADTIYVGVAVSSHVTGVLATASFNDVTVTAAPVAPPVTSTPPSTTMTELRLLDWNTHHGGVGSDGVYNPQRIADWIAKIDPHVATLNEVDNQSQVDAIVHDVEAKTGVNWYYSFAGVGNLVMSRLPLQNKSLCVYPDGKRYAAHLSTLVNGRPLNVWSTHLTVDSASARLAETNAMQACAAGWSEARILTGDYNMQQGSAEYNQSVVGYSDAWLVARALGSTTNFSGNCDGCTRNSRIDYVFTSLGTTFLKIKAARIFDTRDASGVTPSDHKPLLVTFTVS